MLFSDTLQLYFIHKFGLSVLLTTRWQKKHCKLYPTGCMIMGGRKIDKQFLINQDGSFGDDCTGRFWRNRSWSSLLHMFWSWWKVSFSDTILVRGSNLECQADKMREITAMLGWLTPHTSIFGLCFMSVCLMKSNCYSLIYSSLGGGNPL